MVAGPHPDALRAHIDVRTGRQVRHLRVELLPGRVVVRGFVRSFYLKQLAQQAVFELLPGRPVENAIRVGDWWQQALAG